MTEILWRFKDHDLTDFPAGSVMVPEGQETGRLFVLHSGTVEVARHGTAVVRFDEPGTVIGEIATLLKAPHTATVRALTDSRAYVIEDAFHWLEERPAMALHIGALLADRLQRTTALLADLQRDSRADTRAAGLLQTIFANLTGQQGRRPVIHE